MDFVKLITDQGLSIACIVALAWYVLYLSKNFKAELKEFRDVLREVQDAREQDSRQQLEALNNNTMALQRLSDKLDNVKGAKENEG